jgi:hypothetical protein
MGIIARRLRSVVVLPVSVSGDTGAVDQARGDNYAQPRGFCLFTLGRRRSPRFMGRMSAVKLANDGQDYQRRCGRLQLVVG